MGVVEGGGLREGKRRGVVVWGGGENERTRERESGEVGKKGGKGRLNDSVGEAEWQGDAETLGVHVWV